MTWTELEDALYDLITDLTKITVMWANQDAPRPKKPYLTMRLFSDRTIGQDEIRLTAEPGVLDVVGVKELTLELQWFGAKGKDGLQQLWQDLQRPTILEKCEAAGVALAAASSVNDIGRLLGSRLEPRTQMDITVRIAISTIDRPGYIEWVYMEAEYVQKTPDKPVEEHKINTVVVTQKHR